MPIKSGLLHFLKEYGQSLVFCKGNLQQPKQVNTPWLKERALPYWAQRFDVQTIICMTAFTQTFSVLLDSVLINQKQQWEKCHLCYFFGCWNRVLCFSVPVPPTTVFDPTTEPCLCQVPLFKTSSRFGSVLSDFQFCSGTLHKFQLVKPFDGHCDYTVEFHIRCSVEKPSSNLWLE